MLMTGIAGAEGIPAPDLIIFGKITFGTTLVEQGEIRIDYIPVSGGQGASVRAKLDPYYGSKPNKSYYSYKIAIPVENTFPGMEASSNKLSISQQDRTYTRIITISAGNIIRSYTDTIKLSADAQCGLAERRDYNIKIYSIREIVDVLTGIKSNEEGMDPNGDQILDASDVIHSINEGIR